MAVNWVTQWWRAESEIDRLRAENDELRDRLSQKSRVIDDLVLACKQMRVTLDQINEAMEAYQ